MVSGFRDELLHGQTDRLGIAIVRVLALAIAALAIIAALFGTHGGAVYLAWVTAAIFLLTAALPSVFGKVAGGLIWLVTGLALFLGPAGGPAISWTDIVISVPFMLLSAVFMKPHGVGRVLALFAPAR